MKKEKLIKTMIYKTTIEGIDFNVYSASISCLHCHMLAFQNEEIRAINVTINSHFEHEFYDYYFKARLSTYQGIIDRLIRKGRHIKGWEEGHLIFNSYDNYNAKKRQMIEKTQKAEYEERLPDKYEIENVVKNERGYSFSETFLCRLCRTKHTLGYNYLIRGHEVNVCSYCRTDIRRTKNYVKIIPTNMGHNKRG